MDAVLQHLLQGVVVSTDGCGVQHFYEVGHLALGRVVEDSVVPGVGHTLPVDAEHAGGQSVQLAWACLDVIFCVVLSSTCETHLSKFTRNHVHVITHEITVTFCYGHNVCLLLLEDAVLFKLRNIPTNIPH